MYRPKHARQGPPRRLTQATLGVLLLIGVAALMDPAATPIVGARQGSVDGVRAHGRGRPTTTVPTTTTVEVGDEDENGPITTDDKETTTTIPDTTVRFQVGPTTTLKPC